MPLGVGAVLSRLAPNFTRGVEQQLFEADDGEEPHVILGVVGAAVLDALLETTPSGAVRRATETRDYSRIAPS